MTTNAIIASPESGLIYVSIRSEEGSVILTIDDQGEGFDEAFIQIAFERFSRFDKSRSRDTGGSGLGLALVKSILDFYGGSITLSNRTEGGARVEVHLITAPQ